MVSREPDELFKIFVKDFPKLKLKWGTPRTEWTKKLFNYFEVLGTDEGFTVFYHNKPYEYLVDMCWIYESDNFPSYWIEVAFEIELKKDLDAHLQEFDKLVDLKAYTKVLVCRSTVDKREKLLSEASEKIRYNPMRFVEERYLIIVFTITREKLIASGWVMDYVGNRIPLGSSQFPRT